MTGPASFQGQGATFGATGAAAQPSFAASPAAPPPKSRTGLFIGLASVAALGVAAVIAVVAWPSGASSSSGSSASQGAGAQPASPGVALPSPSAQAVSSGGARPGVKGVTPTFGQSPSPSAAPSFGAASPSPGVTGASSSSAAPSASTSTSSAPAGASAKSTGMLSGILMSCWKDNEGANKGEPASSAGATVTVGPPRSVLVSGPAKAKKNFTACVVMRATSAAFDPADSVVSASASLPAGP